MEFTGVTGIMGVPEIMGIMEIVLTPLTIIISLIVARRTYSHHKRKLAAEIISTHRREWIKGLRQVLREFVVLDCTDRDALKSKKYEVELFLDDTDGERNLYKNLREEMDFIVDGDKSDMSDFVKFSQQIIRHEWVHIKVESGIRKRRNNWIKRKVRAWLKTKNNNTIKNKLKSLLTKKNETKNTTEDLPAETKESP